jgi:hypothetical protein
MSQQLRGINAWLAASDIRYVSNEDTLDCVNDRSLRRTFNNGSFEQGGRLYGGFWQQTTMSLKKSRGPNARPYRGHIRIEGESVVVIDFSSMLLRLLYAEAGVQPPAGDLYLGIDRIGPEHRDGIKQVVSALLFRTSPLTKFPRGTRMLFPKGWSAKRVEKAIRKRHAAVAHMLYSEIDLQGAPIGYLLFRRESDVLLAALCECRAQGITALPVHDAIIVKESCAEPARRIMLDAFKATTGFEGQVGEPKRPGDENAVIDTVLNDSGELPLDEKTELGLKGLERCDWVDPQMRRPFAAQMARDYLRFHAPDVATPPDGADDSELW